MLFYRCITTKNAIKVQSVVLIFGVSLFASWQNEIMAAKEHLSSMLPNKCSNLIPYPNHINWMTTPFSPVFNPFQSQFVTD